MSRREPLSSDIDGNRHDFVVQLRSLPSLAAERLPRWTKAALTGPDAAPLLLVLGGISGTCDVADTRDGQRGWWHSLFGSGAALGCDLYRILGIDFVADKDGSYAPTPGEQASIIADTLAALGEEPAAIIGASYGGMVALAYAEQFKTSTALVIISASAEPHASATAARGLQRQVVRLGMNKGCAGQALAIARGMAMLTYRTQEEFGQRFAGGIVGEHPCSASEPSAYLAARGRAYCEVMPPGRFLSLSASIDRHRVQPEKIEASALVIGVEEDQLVPIADVEQLARRLAGPVEFKAINSLYGHDAFLKEPQQLGPMIASFLTSESLALSGLPRKARV